MRSEKKKKLAELRKYNTDVELWNSSKGVAVSHATYGMKVMFQWLQFLMEHQKNDGPASTPQQGLLPRISTSI